MHFWVGDGNVTMVGTVQSKEARAEAEAMVSQLSGVASVKDKLFVGNIENRAAEINYLRQLPGVVEATAIETFSAIEQHRWYGKGLGWVDVQILATALKSNARIWTADKRLHRIAEKLNLAWQP